MDTNLTAHYLAIEREQAQLPEQAARGRLVEEAIATRPKRSGTVAVHRRVGVVLSAMAPHRPYTVRQLLRHIHPAHQSAQGRGDGFAGERQPLDPAKEYAMTARSYHQLFARGHRSIRRLILSAAMLATVAVGLVTPSASVAHGCATEERLAARAGLSPGQRSVVLVEGKDPAHFPVCDTTEFVPISQSQRSIQLIEGKDPANFPTATTEPTDTTVAACADSPHAARTAC
ncbi:MAG TPA: hypothetical protein VGW38_26105 [Chloroflexota bacterium]|nr:hypothetical protein [Chloroflexota bacterium]